MMEVQCCSEMSVDFSGLRGALSQEVELFSAVVSSSFKVPSGYISYSDVK
jgi:hypothetical protein